MTAQPRTAPARLRVGLPWTGLVLLLAAAQLALLWRRFYYGNDDLLQFEVAQRAGLSWEMLSLNVFQHVAPYNRLAHLLVSLTGMSPVAGLAFMTLNLVATLFCCLWFMTELGLSTRRRVLGLVLIGLSVSVSESGIWFDTSMHILSALAVTTAVCAAHVRGVRTGSRRWHVVAFVLFVGGQLFQERPIFALPLALLADVLLLWRTVPWAERLRRLWAIRWPIASLVLAAAAIAVWLQAFVVQPGGTTPSWEATGRTMLLALTDYVLPSVANLPRSSPSPWTVQLVILGGVLAVGLLLAVLRRGNAGPLLFATAAFLLYYGFLKLSPLLIDTPASIAGNAERLHYVVYVTVPLVIALVHLRVPSIRRRPAGPWPRWLGAVLVVGLAVHLAVAGNAYLGRQWAQTTEARAYLDAVRADADEWSSDDVTLIPLSAHPALGTSWAVGYVRHDKLLPLVVRGFTPQDLGPEPVIIDDTGAVRPARLVTVPGRVTLDRGGCGGSRAPAGEVLARADVARTREPAFLVVQYRAPQDVEVQVVTDPGRGDQEGYFRRDLPGGERTRVVPLVDPDVRGVALSTVGDGPLCVERARVVRVLAVDDDGRCREVDRLGHLGDRFRCP
ncbi:hypothetical protein [Blastococcus sp. CT_GayMR16]|uniref:hypothetical protein n=1 Tax=Blastococcus sp. CT_GayMR16 TaxID=2559607 RepID=UPI0010748A39|nr:hypothetical protein [Blastococcus sp. CT_GayMR16]TFV87778.1 hypothetical protein E4P38_12435 [Blastococcus sp. CT_GayMR16]